MFFCIFVKQKDVMTQFNFDKLTQRRGTNSYKWDETDDPDVIPVWVADMDFETAPCIVRALQERVAHGIFGYTFVPESYYEAVTSWFQRRHHWRIDRSWIEYTSGVVPALSATIKALTQPGDKVLVQTPVYNCFFSSIRNNGCEIVESPLQRSANTYVINFDDLEQKLSDPAVKLFVLCNPHNPAGRVWTPDELRRMNDLCLHHNVRVVSDEIHCELTMPGYTYTPFASVSDECLNNSVTLNSPSKSFNTAANCQHHQQRCRHTPTHQPRHQYKRGVRCQPLRRHSPTGSLQRGRSMARRSESISPCQLRRPASLL